MTTISYRYESGSQPLAGYTIQYALGRGGFGEVYFAISESPSSRHWYARIVRQLLSFVPLVMAFAIVTDTMSNREVNALGTCFLGLASSLLIIDWVILVSPRRQKLIAWLPTVVIGIIVAVVSLMGRGDDQALVFDTAVAIATALSLQIVSPLSKRSVEHTSEKPTNDRENQTADSNNTVDVSVDQMQSDEVSV